VSSLSSSRLTINDPINNTTVATIASTGIVFDSPVTISSTLSAPISLQAKAYVDTSISTLIGVGTPSTLDSLKEIATALGNDASLASHLTASIGSIHALINTVTGGSTTVLNTNSQLSIGQYNISNGLLNTLLSLDTNNLSLFNNQLVVNSTTGIQTSSSLYNNNSIYTLLQNYSQ